MKKVIFKEYSKNYPDLFNKEKKQLLSFLKHVKIEHVGSTAVPGLKGTGIIDILVGTKKNFILDNKKLLEENGFIFRDSYGDNKRLFFKKANKDTEWIYVHLVKLNKIKWNDALLFRDFLTANPKEKDYYSKIKTEALNDANGESKLYRKYKEECIEFIINKAKNSKFNNKIV